jgi:hypothetical protein
VSTGTAVYDYKAYSLDSNIPPRFYTQSGARVQLVEPAALLSGFKQAKVVGRLLPRFDPASSQNIDLFAKMKLGASSIQVAASNPTAAVSWAESRLKNYPVPAPGNIYSKRLKLRLSGSARKSQSGFETRRCSNFWPFWLGSSRFYPAA